MSEPALPWFRFYHESLDDPKVQRLPGELYKRWVNLLCLASRNDGTLPPAADVGFSLRIPEEEAAATLERLQKDGLLDATDKGLRPHNWEGRQYHSDNVTERVRRFRARQRKGEQGNVSGGTGRNVSRNVSGNGRETLPETLEIKRQSRTDTEQSRAEQKQTAPGGARTAGAVPPTKPAPKPNKFGEVLDALKAKGVELPHTSRDASAVKDCSATARVIADAYAAAASGEWGDDWLRGNLSLTVICQRIGGYLSWRDNPRPASTARASPNGQRISAAEGFARLGTRGGSGDRAGDGGHTGRVIDGVAQPF